MKTKLLLVTGMFMLFCNQTFSQASSKGNHKMPKGYIIKGQLLGLKDKTVLYLVKRGNINGKILEDTISTTASQGERFSFKGKLKAQEEGVSAYVKISGISYTHSRGISIILENSIISIYAEIAKLKDANYKISITGSQAYIDAAQFSDNEYREYILPARSYFMPAYFKLIEGVDKLLIPDSIKRQITNITEDFSYNTQSFRLADRNKFGIDWIKRHRNSLVAPAQILFLDVNDSIKIALYSQLTARSKGSYYGLVLQKKVKLLKENSIGQTAKDLVLLTEKEESISLLNTTRKNKITIIEFWASWCGPCRRSFPHMKDLYNKYNHKGLEVYAISADINKQAWLTALKHDDLPWLNVIDNGQRVAQKAFNITGFPTTIVVDSNGKILMKPLIWKPEGVELLNKLLEETFGK